MKTLRLMRSAQSSRGTFGVLTHQNRPLCVTCEDPWNDNQVNISCIPAGTYECIPVDSPRFGPTYEVQDVEGRSLIRFHAGNSILDTEGCILLGQHYGQTTQTEIGQDGQPHEYTLPDIRGSQKAFRWFIDEFMADREPFRLDVRNQK